MILPSHAQQMRALLARQPDLTLKELRRAAALNCSLPAVHYALERMGLTYQKRHSMPVSKTVRTLRGRGAGGSDSKPD
jgi:transposase